jgi:hypothetical protein
MPDGVGDIEPNDDGFTAKLLRPLNRSSRVTIWISRTLGRAPTRKCDRTARRSNHRRSHTGGVAGAPWMVTFEGRACGRVRHRRQLCVIGASSMVDARIPLLLAYSSPAASPRSAMGAGTGSATADRDSLTASSNA